MAAIELGFDGQWELTEQDADILVQVGDGDVMWQKERLLNVVLKHLPPECEYVAWIDSDVLFQDPEWPERTIEQLATLPLVQLFSRLRHLERDENCGTPAPCFSSIAADVLGGRPVSADMIGPASAALVGHPVPGAAIPAPKGMAWAARRELLECHGFYDGLVIGGGDTALVFAAYGAPEVVMERWQLNSEQRDHFSRWANGFHRDVKGEVGALTGEIHHLWHGDLEDRGYAVRQSHMVPHRFDPNTDIRLGVDGAWRWDSDKPELHALLRGFFPSRHEDGKTAE